MNLLKIIGRSSWLHKWFKLAFFRFRYSQMKDAATVVYSGWHFCSWGSLHIQLFHRSSYTMEIWFWCKICNAIATQFCTCHNSTTVILLQNPIVITATWIRAEWNLPQIWIMTKTSVKWAPGQYICNIFAIWPHSFQHLVISSLSYLLYCLSLLWKTFTGLNLDLVNAFIMIFPSSGFWWCSTECYLFFSSLLFIIAERENWHLQD